MKRIKKLKRCPTCEFVDNGLIICAHCGFDYQKQQKKNRKRKEIIAEEKNTKISKPYIKLKKDIKTGYSWEISTNGETLEEISEKIDKTNKILIERYGLKTEKKKMEEPEE